MIKYYGSTDSLSEFKDRNEQLAIVKRKKPKESDNFFQKISQSSFSVSGHVSFNNSRDDIHNLLKNQFSYLILNDLFYTKWIDDMSEICKIFCQFQRDEKISFWAGSKRGCSRFHRDIVPYRLLVTYSGKGTEILPNHAANLKAYNDGKPNGEIIKDIFAIQHLRNWDIAIFRGCEEGILHKTPDSALSKSSILMRLDNFTFLRDIQKFNEVA